MLSDVLPGQTVGTCSVPAFLEPLCGVPYTLEEEWANAAANEIRRLRSVVEMLRLRTINSCMERGPEREWETIEQEEARTARNVERVVKYRQETDRLKYGDDYGPA
jgi:hypothetical protein